MNPKDLEKYNAVKDPLTNLVTQKVNEEFQKEQNKRDQDVPRKKGGIGGGTAKKDNQGGPQPLKYLDHQEDKDYTIRLQKISTDYFREIIKALEGETNVKVKTRELMLAKIRPFSDNVNAFLQILARKKVPYKFNGEMIKQLDEYKERLEVLKKKLLQLHTAGCCAKGKVKEEIYKICEELKVYDACIFIIKGMDSRDIILPSGEVVVKEVVEIQLPPDENKIRDLVAKYIKDFLPKEKEPPPPQPKPKEKEKEAPVIQTKIEYRYLPAEPDSLTKAHQYFFGFGTQKNYVQAKKLYEECDATGNPIAAACLGNMYLDGIGVKKDIQRAIDYYLRSASKGDSEGMYKMGALLEKGTYKESDDPQVNMMKALECYKKAAASNHMEALTDLGYIAEHGLHEAKQSFEEAVEFYTRAANQQYPRALNNLGILHFKGQVPGKHNNDRKAFEYFTMASEQGYVKSFANIGICYEKGRGVPHDMMKARLHFELAAEMGDTDGKYNLGYILLKTGSLHDSEEDYNRAANYFREVIAEDHYYSDAHYYLGFMFENGLGTDKDLKTAFKYYSQAARLDNGKAYCKIGNFYKYGIAVGVDKKEAIRAYEKAAELKDAEALNNLGIIYEEGVEVEMNYAKAFDLYNKAARLRGPKAMLNIGLMYEKGRHVEKNLEQAMAHYVNAAERGNVIAQSIVKAREPSRIWEYEQQLDLMVASQNLPHLAQSQRPDIYGNDLRSSKEFLLRSPTAANEFKLQNELKLQSAVSEIVSRPQRTATVAAPMEQQRRMDGPSQKQQAQPSYPARPEGRPSTETILSANIPMERNDTKGSVKESKSLPASQLQSQDSYGAKLKAKASETDAKNKKIQMSISEQIKSNMESIKTPPTSTSNKQPPNTRNANPQFTLGKVPQKGPSAPVDLNISGPKNHWGGDDDDEFESVHLPQ
jgi:TPR repeat protein